MAQFEWDEAKRESNIAKHGIDFFDAAYLFELNYMFWADNRHDYGEVRFKALGMVDGILLCVIYTIRNNNYRIISAHKAGRHDRRKYRSIHDGGNQG
jgi:uncharacterized protein